VTCNTLTALTHINMRQKKYGFRSASSAACLFSFGFQTTDGDPNSMHDRGYAASREEAMADFKSAWKRVADQLVTPPKAKTAG
jgi:hypothetical protein